MRARGLRVIAILAVAGASLMTASVNAQDPQTQGTAQRNAGRGGPRPGGPGGGAPSDQLQVERLLEGWALVQARDHLQLTDEQYPGFVARFTKLSNTRRRVAMARRQLLGDLRVALGQAPTAKDDAFVAKIRALDELTKRGADEIQQATLEIDGVLTAWQRGRFRLFEEIIERKKIEMLRTIGAGRGGAAPGK